MIHVDSIASFISSNLSCFDQAMQGDTRSLPTAWKGRPNLDLMFYPMKVSLWVFIKKGLLVPPSR